MTGANAIRLADAIHATRAEFGEVRKRDWRPRPADLADVLTETVAAAIGLMVRRVNAMVTEGILPRPRSVVITTFQLPSRPTSAGASRAAVPRATSGSPRSGGSARPRNCGSRGRRPTSPRGRSCFSTTSGRRSTRGSSSSRRDSTGWADLSHRNYPTSPIDEIHLARSSYSNLIQDAGGVRRSAVKRDRKSRRS